MKNLVNMINALDLIDKIQNCEIKLAGAKNDQMIFKSHLGGIKKENNKERSKEQKTHYTILKSFTKQETRLLNYLLILIQWYLKQKIKQLKEQDLNINTQINASKITNSSCTSKSWQ